MDKYRLKITSRAFSDIDGIYRYIAMEKLSPENAKGQTDRIWKAIRELDTMPQSHQDRQVGRYARKSYKQLIVDNYIVIYKIDEAKNK